MKLLLMLLLFSTAVFANNCDYVAKSHVYAPTVMSPAGHPVNTWVEAENEVTNNTSKPITVWVQYNMCVDGCGCDPHHWRVVVNPHGTWCDHWRPFKECTFRSPGNYAIRGEASVTGLDNDLGSLDQQTGVVLVN